MYSLYVIRGVLEGIGVNKGQQPHLPNFFIAKKEGMGKGSGRGGGNSLVNRPLTKGVSDPDKWLYERAWM